MKTETLPLKQRWQAFKDSNPQTRIRDAAAELGVTEAELLATGVGSRVVRLEGDWTELIKALPGLGPVMCLTRNEAAVHERRGRFEKIEFSRETGLVTGSDIDLRLFMKHWKFGFAVTDSIAGGERHSFQFFNAHGDAVHKVYLEPEGDAGIFRNLANRFTAPDQTGGFPVAPRPAPPAEQPDKEIDVDGFRAAWINLQDTHEFHPLLRAFGVGRKQALRLAPKGHAIAIPVASVRRMLEAASERHLPIMVFIGNPGCLQIHTGQVSNIKMFKEEWLNVLDPEFNMHLRLPLVAATWIVRKPTRDGIVTALEIHDTHGDAIALFFGKRKPGQPEDERWRALCDELEEGV